MLITIIYLYRKDSKNACMEKHGIANAKVFIYFVFKLYNPELYLRGAQRALAPLTNSSLP